MDKPLPLARIEWAIEARARSQRLLLNLYDFGRRELYGETEGAKAKIFSALVGATFSLWRASFLLASETRRSWPDVLRDAQGLLETVLTTNAIAFTNEHKLQGWTAGFYLKNAKLRLVEIRGKLLNDSDGASLIDAMPLVDTEPHDVWELFCVEAERLAEEIGCEQSKKGGVPDAQTNE
jgi:hypothetical protein